MKNHWKISTKDVDIIFSILTNMKLIRDYAMQLQLNNVFKKVETGYILKNDGPIWKYYLYLAKALDQATLLDSQIVNDRYDKFLIEIEKTQWLTNDPYIWTWQPIIKGKDVVTIFKVKGHQITEVITLIETWQIVNHPLQDIQQCIAWVQEQIYKK